MKRALRSFVLGSAALTAVIGSSSTADACGGFFCSQTQPVNQAAERVVFADNGDGTVTAVIEILYQGPSQNFSWLLPISSVPQGDQIAVASAVAFQRLQAATNPQYSLTTRVEGTCKEQDFNGVPGVGTGGSGSSGGPVNGSGGGGGASGVNVEASGVVGAFEWTVISLDDALEDPAEAAVTWLETNEYDVPSGATSLIRPYLEDGLYLLALRLTKGADVGSIRPIVLTYEAEKPMIPVKLTAVAANEDMGVMTWVLSDARAVPQNYLSLELNEARINWFNASTNYNQVVIDAADDAGGQGFVTEFSGPSTALANMVWSSFDEQAWQNYATGIHSSFSEMFTTAYYQWSTWDGFWEAVETGVTLPEGIEFADFKACPNCYSANVTVDPSGFIAALEEGVIQPVRLIQNLLDAHPQVTRLYTTLSAEEMTRDPLFTFNPDLPEVSNLHTAERIIECNPSVFQFEANWRIELPQGGVVRGTPADVGTWPEAFNELPPNFTIRQAAEKGEGNLLEDNAEKIDAFLADYNAGFPAPAANGGEGGAPTTGGTGANVSGSTSTAGTNSSGGTNDGSGGESPDGEAGDFGTDAGPESSGCSCRVAGGSTNSMGALALLGLAGLSVARRRRRR